MSGRGAAAAGPGEDSYGTIVEFIAEEGRFERGLARLLDDIEAEFAPR